MGNIDQMGQQMMTPQGRQEGMDLAMKMVTGGMTMPKTSLANEALYGQRDKIARLLNPKNLGYIREGVIRGGNTIQDWSSLSNIAKLIEKGKDTPENLRSAMELLKMIGLIK